jgi:ATP-binding cassette subfamily B protein
MLLQVVFTVTIAIVLKWIVDGIVEGSAGQSAIPAILILAAALLVSTAAAVTGARLAAIAAARILADVRTALFDRLQRLSIGFFATSNEGDLMARFSSDIAQLSDGVIKRPVKGLRSLAAMAFYVPVMLVLDYRLGIPAAVLTPIAIYLVNRFAPEADKPLDEEKLSIASVLDRVSETIKSQQVVRVFGLGSRARDRFRESIGTLESASTRAEFRVELMAVLSQYSISFIQLVVIAAGALMAFDGSIEAGTFAAFVALLGEVTKEMTVLGSDVFPQIRRAGSGIRRVDELLSAGPVDLEPVGAVAPPHLAEGISFDGVTFSYDANSDRQLSDLTTTIRAGAHTAIVGRNGSGKSTLLSLLLRLYPPQAGTIRVDGIDLAALDVDAWRTQCGVVFQDTAVFDQTLRDNILLGASLPDDGLVSVVQQVGLGDLVARLPHGLDTMIGSQGRRLSGGERQRVGLARALVRDPQLLLLDEVTAALDPATEVEINRLVRRLAADRTVISVTHRLRAAQNADLVLAMHGGRVVETGPFEELVRAGGVVADIWRRQQGFTVSRDGSDAAISTSRLGSFSLFNGFDERQLAVLAERFSPRLYDINDVVVREGGPADRFFIIARGVVEVIMGDGAKMRVVAHLEDGDFFGEMALMEGAPRNATVIAVTPTTMLSLERSQFEDLLREWPEAATRIRSVAAARADSNRTDPLG